MSERYESEGFRKIFFAPLSRGVAWGNAAAGGCSSQSNSSKANAENTPLRPSQEGNRTIPVLLFCFAYSGFQCIAALSASLFDSPPAPSLRSRDGETWSIYF